MRGTPTRPTCSIPKGAAWRCSNAWWRRYVTAWARTPSARAADWLRGRGGAMARAGLATDSAGRLQRLEFLELALYVEVAEVEHDRFDDAVHVQTQLLLMLRLRRAVVVLEECQMDPIGGDGRQQRRAAGRAGLGPQVLGDERADIGNAVLVEAVEDRRPQEVLAGLDMLQQGDGVGGREQRARRQLDLAALRHGVVGDTALARSVQVRFAAILLLHLPVLEIADEEAVAQPVLGLPGHQVPAELDGLARLIGERHGRALGDAPAVAGVFPIELHGAGDVDDLAVALAAGQRQIVDRPVRSDLEGERRNPGTARTQEESRQAQPGDERVCEHRRRTIQEIAVSALRKLWHGSAADNCILRAVRQRAARRSRGVENHG